MKIANGAWILAVFGLAVVLSGPAWTADWIDKTVLDASERVLSTMPADFYQLDPAAARQQIESAKPFVLDVREAAEAATGRIAGATNVPLRELPKLVAKLPASKTAPILTYCHSGYRGGIAMTVLRMWGYTNVRNIKGGFDGWVKAGLPVEK